MRLIIYLCTNIRYEVHLNIPLREYKDEIFGNFGYGMFYKTLWDIFDQLSISMVEHIHTIRMFYGPCASICYFTRYSMNDQEFHGVYLLSRYVQHLDTDKCIFIPQEIWIKILEYNRYC